MTGFKDIDGSMLMAGSPDALGCAAISLRDLLGDYAWPGTPKADPKSLHYSSFVRISTIPETDENRSSLERFRKAVELMRDAAELLDGLRFDGVNR